MRRWLTAPCEGEWLAVALDEAPGTTGVLMVSGGTELACGAHGAMARIAADLAARGFPTVRFDRRGVGDSTGADPGFAASAPDIAAALAALKAQCPHVTRVVATGNCDAACALLLARAEVDATVLTNVWLDRQEGTGEAAALPPAAAIRRRYLQKLTSPKEWWRLVSGGVDFRKLLAGLGAARRVEPATDLTRRLASSLAANDTPVTLLLAEHDATAMGFSAALGRAPLKFAAQAATVIRYPSRSHSFAEAADRTALVDAIAAAAGRARPNTHVTSPA